MKNQERKNMIKKIFNYFRKPKPTLIWMHINNSQYYGVIGWLATDRKTFVKGQDNWKREGELRR
jgi:hypothetical protein